MSEIRKDLNSTVKSVVALKAQATAATDTLQTTALDGATVKRGKLVISTGTCTDGEYTPEIHTSATAGGSYAAQAVANSEYVSGVAPTVITAATDETLYVYDIDFSALDNRFVKFNLAETSAGTTGVVISAVWEIELKVRPQS